MSDKKLFDAAVKSGLYIHYLAEPLRKKSPGRYEIIDKSGKLISKGANEQEAIDQARRKFQGRQG